MADPVLAFRAFPRPEPGLVAAFADTPTGFVVDAMGRRGALSADIRRLCGSGVFVGTALTVWTVPRDNLAPYAALDAARPGDVLVVTNGGARDASILGDLAIGMARNCGVIAVVTDGLVRDIAGIREVGIPVHAPGLSPNSPFKNGPGEIGGTVSIGGVAVSAGDIVVGDEDGVVVVPLARAAAVRDALAAVRKKEAEMDAAVRGGLRAPAWLADVLAGPGVQREG